MASTVTFWQMPEEEDVFFNYLARTGEVFAIPMFEAVTDKTLIQAAPIESFLGRVDRKRLYLTLHEFALDIPLHIWPPEVPEDPVRYSLTSALPAIIYDAGTLLGIELDLSNVTADTTFWDEDAKEIRPTPEGFVKWMRRVMGWIRRVTPEWHEYKGYRATQKVVQATKSGTILVPYHGWSGSSTGCSSFMPRSLA